MTESSFQHSGFFFALLFFWEVTRVIRGMGALRGSSCGGDSGGGSCIDCDDGGDGGGREVGGGSCGRDCGDDGDGGGGSLGDGSCGRLW